MFFTGLVLAGTSQAQLTQYSRFSTSQNAEERDAFFCVPRTRKTLNVPTFLESGRTQLVQGTRRNAERVFTVYCGSIMDPVRIKYRHLEMFQGGSTKSRRS